MRIGDNIIDETTSINLSAFSGLLARARSDPESFALLYRRHYDVIFRYCVHRLFVREAAEDVTSEVFLNAFRKFQSFDGTDEHKFRNWLYRIATNAVNNHLRKLARRNRMLTCLGRSASIVCDSQHEFKNTNSEKIAILHQSMASLKPRYQTIITMRFFENLKLTEIAEILDSKPATVRTQLSRALAELRRKITDSRKGADYE
jgi:RNA polymerase sigma-70 factor (ECF subfamily)